MAWTRRQKGAALIAVATLSLVATFAITHQCTVHDWSDHYQYRHYCYSDLLPIYGAHGHDQDLVPYLEPAPDGVNEYPVLTGLFSYAVSLFTEGMVQFMVWSSILLLAAGAGTSWALWRLGGQGALLAWALAPTMPVHGLTNWDLLAVGLAAWGWYAWRRSQPLVAALAFGLGGAAKLYPAFFLPFLFLDVLRREWPELRQRWADRRSGATAEQDGVADRQPGAAAEPDRVAAWQDGTAAEPDRLTSADVPESRGWPGRGALKTLVGGTLGFAGPNLAIAAAAPHAWLATWTFHADRHPDFETPWQAFLKPLLQPLFPSFDWGDGWADFVADFSTAFMALALLWLAWRVWRRGVDPLAAGAGLTLVFLLVNRVYSPQYTLWALPLLLLLRAGWKPTLLYVAADTVNFLVRYQLFIPDDDGGWADAWEPWSRLAVNLRWLFLAWATYTVFHRHRLVPAHRGRTLLDEAAGEPPWRPGTGGLEPPAPGPERRRA